MKPTRYITPAITAIAAVMLPIMVWMVFVDTPLQVSYQPDSRHFVMATGSGSLFFNYKIFYFHVAHAFMLFLAVGVCGVASIGFLVKRDPRWDDVALAAAEVAAFFGAVVLLTGSIWAKAAWDKWWIWENRLTMSLLLWLTLVGYVLVRRFAGTSGERIAAGMAVFAMVGVPFIYTMVGSGDNHPKAGGGGNVANLSGPIMKVFWLSVLTFFAWFLALVLNRIQSARLEREVRTLREKALDAGVLE